MLHLTHPNTRRNFLSVGSLALGGLALPQLLRAQEAIKQSGGVVKDKTVVFLFMHGGPTQTETFDPKMDAPSGIRSATGEVRTTLPGVSYGATFSKLAKLAHKSAIVRSFTTGDGNHDIKPVVSAATFKANLGSIYARVAGPNHPRTGMPRNLALYPQAVDPATGPAITNFGQFGATGPLGPAYTPFAPSGDGDLKRDMKLTIAPTRLDDRRALLGGLDQWRRSLETGSITEGLDRFQAQAFDTLGGGVAEAFDLSKENPRTLERYDTSGLMDVNRISRRWNNYKHYGDHVKSLGKLMLLARRLAERGAGFITVTTSFVWDMHADSNNATVTEGMQYVGAPFDHAVSAFIEDCEARGLGDKILLVCCGEMGRTPRINRSGGRDHWGGSAPLLLYGGGLKMGQVIGQSTKDGGEPAADPVTIPNLNATIMHTLLDPGVARTLTGLPREVAQVINGAPPIHQLF
ncbi:MAG: DUF1501 domain-containing protein [Pedosphaera sp.]|nr:DUF1501 domain-containing protein [Pedosphaera sp.]MSU42644.1 DUF1501 domain-containing protein [Pedosphaera sp.]